MHPHPKENLREYIDKLLGLPANRGHVVELPSG